MSVTTVSSAAQAAQLVKLANGEYTAASVTANQKEATKLGLVKEADGNYGTTPPKAADAITSPNALTTLDSIKLGG